MELPDDGEMFRIFRAQSEHDPQMVRDLIADPSGALLLDSAHEQLHDIVQGVGEGEENVWYLIPEAQEWVREHGNDIIPSDA
jgi:hypothetical protein